MYRLCLLFLFVSTSVLSQPLPRSTPEKEGVSSIAVANFLQAISKSKNELHGFVFVRHGKVIADAWSAPYADSLKHTLYSTSKSFTSTAVGFAVAENKLKVTDKVVSFFPESVPDNASELLKRLTIKDLLTMSVGHATDPSAVIPSNRDWVRQFLATPIVDTPGTKFLYNSMATFMLSAIVQKVTGEKIIDYLEPRLFKPLGITNKDWETNPEGINVGGWGLRVRTSDMAKFGLLYLNKGKWNGKQILPEAWVREASTAHIRQKPNASAEELANSEWVQGYGYQFWRSRHNSYRADGAFGQYILIMPEQDAVIAITCETANMQDEVNYVWNYLKPAMSDRPLPENPNGLAQLKKVASSLTLRPFISFADSVGKVSPLTVNLKNKSVTLDENQLSMQSLSFDEVQNRMMVLVKTPMGEFPITFGHGKWVSGTTAIKPPSLTSRAINSLEGLAPFRVAGQYRWKDKNTLELQLQYPESTHHTTWTCDFSDDRFKMEIRNSFSNFREDKIDATITGK
jgi:CubicO group peptidase (beta-lactamase class C family)